MQIALNLTVNLIVAAALGGATTALVLDFVVVSLCVLAVSRWSVVLGVLMIWHLMMGLLLLLLLRRLRLLLLLLLVQLLLCLCLHLLLHLCMRNLQVTNARRYMRAV